MRCGAGKKDFRQIIAATNMSQHMFKTAIHSWGKLYKITTRKSTENLKNEWDKIYNTKSLPPVSKPRAMNSNFLLIA